MTGNFTLNKQARNWQSLDFVLVRVKKAAYLIQ